jgi:hypothetical protein
MTIRVLLCDDQALVRDGFRMILNAEEGRGGQLSEPPLDHAVPPRHGEHLHAGVGQRGHALHQRAESPRRPRHGRAD